MSTNRSAQLLALRPIIPGATTDVTTSVQERFQNLTLRPILKFQHELLVALFHHHAQKKKNLFYQLPKEKQAAYIKKLLATDLQFRHELKGLVIGHFTTEEFLLYKENTTGLNKRIFGMITERLLSAC